MRKYLMLTMLSLSLIWVNTVRAGQITDLQLFDGTSGSPTATIYYTNADGTGSNSVYVSVDPLVSAGTTRPLYYCVDLWHQDLPGQSYPINRVSSLVFSNSTYSDADNRIGWLLTQDQSTPDNRAAVQLAIWYTIDNVHNPSLAGYSMSSGDSVLTSDYNYLITFAGYDPRVNYSAEFWAATHDSTDTMYQDLVSACPGKPIHCFSVPEPSSLVLCGISVLLGIGVQLWRRGMRAPGQVAVAGS